MEEHLQLRFNIVTSKLIFRSLYLIHYELVICLCEKDPSLVFDSKSFDYENRGTFPVWFQVLRANMMCDLWWLQYIFLDVGNTAKCCAAFLTRKKFMCVLMNAMLMA